MTAPMPPGWYPAMGDPPGTHRFWDGQTWQGNPQPVSYMAPPVTYPESSNAIAALICSIGGVVFCGVLFPVGWWLASNELEGIAAGRRDPTNKGLAQAGRIVGIVGTLFMVAMIALAAVFVLTAIAA